MSSPTPEEINAVLEGYELAAGAADYADTIKFEMQQVSGDNYKMVWSTEYNGGFSPNKNQ